VLEATSMTRGQTEMQYLLVRLTNNGKVEWDKYARNAWERQTSSVSAERVSKIQRTLDSIDKSQLHGAMGPYHVYVDTSVELRIQMTVRQGEVTFSVTNPWSDQVCQVANGCQRRSGSLYAKSTYCTHKWRAFRSTQCARQALRRIDGGCKS
jgi:hypothetical protein